MVLNFQDSQTTQLGTLLTFHLTATTLKLHHPQPRQEEAPMQTDKESQASQTMTTKWESSPQVLNQKERSQRRETLRTVVLLTPVKKMPANRRQAAAAASNQEPLHTLLPNQKPLMISTPSAILVLRNQRLRLQRRKLLPHCLPQHQYHFQDKAAVASPVEIHIALSPLKLW